MFQQFKNIDTAFRHIRSFSVAFLLVTLALNAYLIYRTTVVLQAGRQKVYLLANGKLLDAVAVDRADYIAVEIRDHVKMFHQYFYSLEPDEKVNEKHITAACYLADSSAAYEYKNLSDNGYYSRILEGNISQQVEDPDSIKVDVDHLPFTFLYYGKLRIVRPTSILTRSLITTGTIRHTTISDNNPHGFLIEHWKVLDNRDLTLEKR
ncbi:conjugative transposon protein TraK [Dinghuibacter silviterrae]|uniref:Conjugative transposon TraK protein n=1 Tax=Dinghuibacter silviterrae TaxID=1539049 RepID=A0A4R8DHC1_9BACT|nr:conjugative transposon protein TraK [Dinghuibacter silviterrae]TDW97109.1 conjugative transposon TraK protein [Dinghuibacter silviterrae]